MVGGLRMVVGRVAKNEREDMRRRKDLLAANDRKLVALRAAPFFRTSEQERPFLETTKINKCKIDRDCASRFCNFEQMKTSCIKYDRRHVRTCVGIRRSSSGRIRHRRCTGGHGWVRRRSCCVRRSTGGHGCCLSAENLRRLKKRP